MSPKVSFVVAIYNVAQYIEQCVRSLYEQTLEDIEIVLVDDCSPDNSLEIALRVLDEYPHRKPQVKVMRHEKNLMNGRTRHDGLNASIGQYVHFIDGDDYVDPQMAELMYSKAVEEDADVVVCDYYWYKLNGAELVTLVRGGIVGNGENVRDDTINRDVNPSIWCKLIRRKIFLDNEILWPVCGRADDVVLSDEVLYYAHKISHVLAPLYHYRLNPNSICNIKSPEHSERRMKLYVQNNAVLFEFLEREGVSEKYEKGILVNKLFVKNDIINYTDKRKYARLWLRTYPEVNKIMFWGNKNHKSTYREKIWLLAICLGLYPKLKHCLLSKRFRPAAIWRRGAFQ